MKNNFLLLAIIILAFRASAQTFAPVGATWHYNYTEQGDTGFVKIESTHDTIILGQNCQALKLWETCKFHGENRISQTGDYEVYLHTSMDSVFLYHAFIDSFQLLYAFNAQVGDSWSFVLGKTNSSTVDTVQIEVDSIYTETINGQLLRNLAVSYTIDSYNAINQPKVTNSHFSEIIGDDNFLFNFPGNPSDLICDGLDPSRLRCYSDNAFGSFATGIVDSCSHYGAYVGVEELDFKDLTLWPNPVICTLQIENNFNSSSEVNLYDITGSLILTQKFSAKKTALQLDLSELPSGIYFVKVKSKTTMLSKRIVKE
tara:strand:- start:23564 stop:24505 length:942 start_codon:yes stop_codon:yes gene_type:complete